MPEQSHDMVYCRWHQHCLRFRGLDTPDSTSQLVAAAQAAEGIAVPGLWPWFIVGSENLVASVHPRAPRASLQGCHCAF